MLVSQADIDAVLNQAQEAIEDISETTGVDASPVEAVAAAALAGPVAAAGEPSPEGLRRVLQLQVPVIVRLAKRKLRVSEILVWGRGTIVEFDKPVEAPLELLVNNKCIGVGEAVKVGENFGLRVSQIHSAESRIRSLGGL